jgi:hypothetical protein
MACTVFEKIMMVLGGLKAESNSRVCLSVGSMEMRFVRVEGSKKWAMQNANAA